MAFDPTNKIVKLCLQGMAMEGAGKPEDGRKIFSQAWDEAANDFEKFLAAFYLAQNQKDFRHKLKWFEKSLECAIKANNPSAQSAFSTLYSNIAKCFEDLGAVAEAKRNRELAVLHQRTVSDAGPFYHGTKADLKVGDFLTAGAISNYDSEITMNHIYFTALVNGAGLAAALAKGDGRERVYKIEPTGPFENDPNVTDKKFPGNLTRSYRSRDPLKIIGEVTDWKRQTKEELEKFREKVAKGQGKIIN